MRDPKRIDVVIDKLRTLWKQCPDLRLGQLLTNLADGKDIFNVEDDVWEKQIDKKTASVDYITPKAFCPKCGSELRIGSFDNPDCPCMSDEFPVYKLICDECDFVSKEYSTDYGEIISSFLHSTEEK